LIATVQSPGIAVMDQYVDDVLSGRAIVGKHVRNAVERHARDLERDDVSFDRERADMVIQLVPALFRHTVGKYVRQPFVLSPWQAFILGCIFGWRRSDGKRRFRVSYNCLGRKNGKSTLAAVIAHLMAGFDGEAQSQVYIGATKLEQSRIIFKEADRMAAMSPHLKKLVDSRVSQLLYSHSNSYIQALGSDKAFDGLNPHCVLFDELHAWRELHRPFYDTLTTGSAARTQPLRVVITTAGDTRSAIWNEENDYAMRVASGEIQDDSYLAFVACLDDGDDVFDEANWPKSMPNLGVSVDVDYLRDEAVRCKASPAGINRWTRYFANRKVSDLEQAIDPEKWSSCDGVIGWWKDADAVACAVDAGGISDLMAVAAVARFKDGVDDQGKARFRYESMCRVFIDHDSQRDLTQQPWGAWVQQGHLIRTQSLYNATRKVIDDWRAAFGVRQIGFDPWNMQQMGEELQTDGYQAIRIAQSRYNMHEPTQLLIDLVDKRKLKNDGNPLVRWAVGNLVLHIDSDGKCKPDRKHSTDKIDPVAAIIMALRLASLAPSKPTGPLFVS
jgi:phage terminase large subunit-like protein